MKHELSKERLEEIASGKANPMSDISTPTIAEVMALAAFALSAYEQEPVPNYISSKNALDSIISFITSNNNPTLNDYNSVSERLFADNCQSLSSHVIEYIMHIGEALEDLRQDATHHEPVHAVPDEWTWEQARRFVRDHDISFPIEAAHRAVGAFRAVILKGDK